jgi:hypothetical protein
MMRDLKRKGCVTTGDNMLITAASALAVLKCMYDASIMHHGAAAAAAAGD